jgi:hypothetical protein
MGCKWAPKFSSPSMKALGLPIIAALTLTATGCSSGLNEDEPPKAEKLCDGAVSSSAKTALEKLTGTSAISSTMGTASRTPQELRKRALEWGAGGDPWKSNTERWFCSVGDRDEEKTLGIGSSWSLVDFSYASAEINKGSKKYLKVSPDAIIEKGRNGRVDVYFPCRVTDGGKETATYTLEVDVSTEISETADAPTEVNKVILSVARWMSSEMSCANAPDIPASAQPPG